MKEGTKEYWEGVTSDSFLVRYMLEECFQMCQRCIDVGVGCVTCLLQLCIGAVNVHMHAITVGVYLLVCMCRLVEGGYFHGVYNCGRGEESDRVGMIQPLGLHTSVLIYI